MKALILIELKFNLKEYTELPGNNAGIVKI